MQREQLRIVAKELTKNPENNFDFSEHIHQELIKVFHNIERRTNFIINNFIYFTSPIPEQYNENLLSAETERIFLSNNFYLVKFANEFHLCDYDSNKLYKVKHNGIFQDFLNNFIIEEKKI